MVLELKAPPQATPAGLFALSPVFLSYAFLGDHPREPLAVSVYAANLGFAALGFVALRGAVAARDHGRVELHLRQRRKNLMTMGLYLSAIPLAQVSVWLSYGVFVLIPALYFMPERVLAPAPCSVRTPPCRGSPAPSRRIRSRPSRPGRARWRSA